MDKPGRVIEWLNLPRVAKNTTETANSLKAELASMKETIGSVTSGVESLKSGLEAISAQVMLALLIGIVIVVVAVAPAWRGH